VLLNKDQIDSPALKIEEGDVLTVYGQDIVVKYLVTLVANKPQ
jgi:hypothetical protein